MTEEIWKEVYHKGRYVGKKISNTGKLVCDNGRVCVLADNGGGYLTYHVTSVKVDGKWKAVRQYAHRLVAEYFLPNPHNLPQVNHKDCNKANNHVDNLEWSKRCDNIKHAHASGRMRNRTENAEIDVLTVEQVIDLYTAVKRDCVGITVKANEMGIPRTTASSVMNKRSRAYITDVIDFYLLRGDAVRDRMLTREDLGLGERASPYKAKTKARADSSSGVVGVYRRVIKGTPIWCCSWSKLDGKQGNKAFSVNKYGEQEAFRLACEYRAKMIEELNQQGAGYTDRHGT